jgi:hypothetical protein
MKERPILFSGPMVRAILNGSKTQTRRVVKDNILVGYTEDDNFFPLDKCPYGKVGDRLWVRETWRFDEFIGSVGMISDRDETPLGLGEVRYRADEFYPEGTGNWKPSIHMPKSISRITLEITDIRVERLQYIDNKDAQAEGPESAHPHRHGSNGLLVEWPGDIEDEIDEYADRHNTGYNDCWICSFKLLWQSINGPKSWYENPWVWVVEFKRCSP